MNRNDYNKLAYQFVQLDENLSFKDKDTILQGLLRMLEADDPNFNRKNFVKKVNNIKNGYYKGGV